MYYKMIVDYHKETKELFYIDKLMVCHTKHLYLC